MNGVRSQAIVGCGYDDEQVVLVHLEPTGADIDAAVLDALALLANETDWTFEGFPAWPPTIEAGWFRRYPWCPCGEGHTWHWDEATEGARGAFFGLMVSLR